MSLESTYVVYFLTLYPLNVVWKCQITSGPLCHQQILIGMYRILQETMDSDHVHTGKFIEGPDLVKQGLPTMDDDFYSQVVNVGTSITLANTISP